MKLLQKIEIIIKFIEQTITDYIWYQNSQFDAEMDGTNLSHEMIGITQNKPRESPPNAKKRAYIATKWQKALLRRETAKDYLRLNQSLIDLIESNDGKRFTNKLKQVLGDTRKQEVNMANRFYAERKTDTAPKNEQLENAFNQMIKDWKLESKESCKK